MPLANITVRTRDGNEVPAPRVEPDHRSAWMEYEMTAPVSPPPPPKPATSGAPNISGEGFDKMLAAFHKARAAGLKKPKLKCGDLLFSFAPETGKNPGHVYIKSGSVYIGKVTPQGRFFPSQDATQDEITTVTIVGRDPVAAAIAHGHKSGNCAICSKRLDRPESVERGIGPICAKKFGW